MPKRKLTQDEINLAFGHLHGQSDTFMEIIQLKAGLRLLHDDEEVNKEKLKYAEEVLTTRINDILNGMVPGIQKRTKTLRELTEKEIGDDLLMKLFLSQEYVFHLSIKHESGETEEREVSPRDMLYLQPVQPPYKWKLASIELTKGEDDWLFNLVFSQGLMEANQPATPMTTTSTSTIPAAIKTQGKFYLYSFWCGNCTDYTHFGLPVDATRVDEVKCVKCGKSLLSPAKHPAK